jgi:hypothetical protein
MFNGAARGTVTVFHGTTELFEYVSKTLSGQTHRERPTPIMLWENHDYDSHVMQCLLNRLEDPYTDIPTWVKYPHLSSSVYDTVINRLDLFVWNPLSKVRMGMIPRRSVRDMYRSAGYDGAWLNRFGNIDAENITRINPWASRTHQHQAIHAQAAQSRKIQNHSAFGAHYSRGKEETGRALREYWQSPQSQFDSLLKILDSTSQFTGRAPILPPIAFDIEADMAMMLNGQPDILPTGFGHLSNMLDGGFKRGEMGVMVAGCGPDPELMRLITEERVRCATAFACHDAVQRNKDKKK